MVTIVSKMGTSIKQKFEQGEIFRLYASTNRGTVLLSHGKERRNIFRCDGGYSLEFIEP